jgi:hypothetical protein
MYVKNLAKRLHKSKVPSLLFKLDIRKAFDSVRWDYILELLRRHGFPPKFRNWITALFCTASSRVLLNWVPGMPIFHGKGLRQGDPLSPLLFVLAIDPLQKMLELATSHNLLHKLKGRGTIFWASLYADDVAVFMLPLKEDIKNLSASLTLLVMLPAYIQTSKKARSFLSIAMTLTLTTCLEGYRSFVLLSLPNIWGFHFRFGNSKEWTSNSLRTKWSGNLSLGMAKTSMPLVEEPLSNPSSPPKKSSILRLLGFRRGALHP